jgi:hypothetical protein
MMEDIPAYRKKSLHCSWRAMMSNRSAICINDKTGMRQEETVEALEFIGRMVQHIPPIGFHPIGMNMTRKLLIPTLTFLLISLGGLLIVFVQSGVSQSIWETENQQENSLWESKLLPEGSFSAPTQGSTGTSSRIPEIQGVNNASHYNLKQAPMTGEVKRGGAVIYTSESSLMRQVQTNTENSGLQGRTIVRVYSGAEGGKTIERTSGMEFAVAPIEDDSPVYNKATFVKSDEQGMFKVALPPGRYWIGPKAKAVDPEHLEKSTRSPLVFTEQFVTVNAGIFTQVEVLQEAYAP